MRAARMSSPRPRSRCCSEEWRCSSRRSCCSETARLTFTPRTASALLYLIFVGAIAGFSAYAYALKHLPVATVSLYAYVNPVIAVVLGTLVLKEPFSVRMIGAALVVFVGIALVSDRQWTSGLKSSGLQS